MTYLQKRILTRYRKERAKKRIFNPEGIITQWDVESGQHTTRHYTPK